jgi:hypothetical protein
VEAWIREHDLPAREPVTHEGGHKWVHALRQRLDGSKWRPGQQQLRPQPAPPLVRNCSEVLKVEMAAEEMLFEGYPLPARGATLRVGAARSGKTVLAVQEALAIASANPLFDNYRVLDGKGATMLVEQDDPGGVASIKTILERSGAKPDWPFHLVPQLSSGFGPQMLDWPEKQITLLRLRLVILDSYTALRGSRGGGIDIVKSRAVRANRNG